jgi:hypothetical protein
LSLAVDVNTSWVRNRSNGAVGGVGHDSVGGAFQVVEGITEVADPQIDVVDRREHLDGAFLSCAFALQPQQPRPPEPFRVTGSVQERVEHVGVDRSHLASLVSGDPVATGQPVSAANG